MDDFKEIRIQTLSVKKAVCSARRKKMSERNLLMMATAMVRFERRKSIVISEGTKLR